MFHGHIDTGTHAKIYTELIQEKRDLQHTLYKAKSLEGENSCQYYRFQALMAGKYWQIEHVSLLLPLCPPYCAPFYFQYVHVLYLNQSLATPTYCRWNLHDSERLVKNKVSVKMGCQFFFVQGMAGKEHVWYIYTLYNSTGMPMDGMVFVTVAKESKLRERGWSNFLNVKERMWLLSQFLDNHHFS